MSMRRFFLVLFVIMGNLMVFGQPTPTITVSISPDLANLSFGSLSYAKDVPNTQLVFQVNIDGVPPLQDVQVYGMLRWKDIGAGDFEDMGWFLTEPMRRRNFSNLDLGKSIEAKNANNDDLIAKNLKKGKPVGTYEITLYLFKADPSLRLHNANPSSPYFLAASIPQALVIENPSQTLSLTEPITGTSFDAGNVTATWTPVIGVSGYRIKANYFRFPNQSIDEALRSGEAIIDNKDVGLQTSVNLRTLMTREWTPGKSVALQVYGVVSGVGQENIYSQPVSFIIKPQMNAAMQSIMNNIGILSQAFSSALPPDLLNQLANGNVVVTDIRLEDGTVLSEAQVRAILVYLQSHPNDILSVTFRQN